MTAADWTGVDYARDAGPRWSTSRCVGSPACAGAFAAVRGAMKTTHRKQLRLNHETIRNLSRSTLERVVGGISRFECGTENVNCGTDGSGGVTCDSGAS